MITVPTEGRCKRQLMATCGTVLPVSAATASKRIDNLVKVLVVNRRAAFFAPSGL